MEKTRYHTIEEVEHGTNNNEQQCQSELTLKSKIRCYTA